MEAIVIYDNKKDRELLDLIYIEFPIFMHYIDFNSKDGRKEAYKIKSHWGAIKNPFAILVDNDGNPIKVFYSDAKGDSAIYQLINYLNNECKNKETA